MGQKKEKEKCPLYPIRNRGRKKKKIIFLYGYEDKGSPQQKEEVKSETKARGQEKG